ncbi:protein Mis18-alpha isoform X2 [Cynoglossus semilaevis]|uniref:protein Mis18-alpha isoform X2 n=1 Tax=Cynoglossus semilaevis TaxID=244447 RepID=UPI000D6286C7|nr:protein Mis18-alpha isoform X2 [Cynoglossus semilaevis]
MVKMADRVNCSKPKQRQKLGSSGFQPNKAEPVVVSGNIVKHNSRKTNATFEASSINAEMVEEQLLGSDNEDTDGHVVFICGKCKLPVGDSMSWDGSEDEQNQIRLKSVTENVKIGKESRLYEAGKESPCLVTDLFCRGCHTLLGMIYRSTPKNLDHKRFAFCFNVADIDSYMLGSASQTLAAEGPKEQLLTLEYRKTVEQELSKTRVKTNHLKALFLIM